MKVVLCGSIQWRDELAIAREISLLPEDAEMRIGRFSGADKLGTEMCRRHGRTVHGIASGLHDLRKQPIDLVIAFAENPEQSTGTMHIVQEAMRQGIEVRTICKGGKMTVIPARKKVEQIAVDAAPSIG